MQVYHQKAGKKKSIEGKHNELLKRLSFFWKLRIFEVTDMHVILYSMLKKVSITEPHVHTSFVNLHNDGCHKKSIGVIAFTDKVMPNAVLRKLYWEIWCIQHIQYLLQCTLGDFYLCLRRSFENMAYTKCFIQLATKEQILYSVFFFWRKNLLWNKPNKNHSLHRCTVKTSTEDRWKKYITKTWHNITIRLCSLSSTHTCVNKYM